MSVYYSDDHVTLHHGDCLDVLRSLPDASVDAVVTDPPYGLANTDPQHVADTITRWVNGDRDYIPSGAGFMGAAWDAFVPPVAVWDECLRVLKPGGHVLAFAGTRTVDLMTLGLRLAGFEIRDSIAWLYGSGFPKSLDVSKAIDKAAGAERTEVIGPRRWAGRMPNGGALGQMNDDAWVAKTDAEIGGETAPATPDAERWQGWGTALKPAFEPVVVARKPLAGTVAANVLAWGTGALNIDATRVGETVETWPSSRGPNTRNSMAGGVMAQTETGPAPAGRWPANVVLDEEMARRLDEQSGESTSQGGSRTASRGATQGASNGGMQGGYNLGAGGDYQPYGDTGGASRFFPTFRYETTERYRETTSASPAGRWPANVVLDEEMARRLDEQSGESTSRANRVSDERVQVESSSYGIGQGRRDPSNSHTDTGGASRFFPTFRYEAKAPTSERPKVNGVAHPTVKPLDLCRWLVRLVTPPGGTVLEPFAGSGTTVEACVIEGFRCIAIEKTEEYLPLTVARINRQRNPVEAIRQAGDDLGLFEGLEGMGA